MCLVYGTPPEKGNCRPVIFLVAVRLASPEFHNSAGTF